MPKVLGWGIIGVNGRLCEMTLRESEAQRWRDEGREVADLSVVAFPKEDRINELAIEYATTMGSFVMLKEFLWHIRNGEPLPEDKWPDWHRFLRKKEGQDEEEAETESQ